MGLFSSLINTTTTTVTPVANLVATPLTSTGVGALKASYDAKFEARVIKEMWLERWGLQDEGRYDRFEPPRDPVEQVTINGSELDAGGIETVRDGIVSARFGYLDQSELTAAGALDGDGYVVDVDQVYEIAGTQTLVSVQQGENWAATEIEFARSNYEIVRILEEEVPGIYQANVALVRDLDTGEYTISVGGTDTLEDVATDAFVFVADDTGPHGAAVDRLISQLWADDIPEDAVVNLAGQSLGAGAVLEVYHADPDAYNMVYSVQGLGFGGEDGAYYREQLWDGMGDANIVEIQVTDTDNDFNTIVDYYGHVSAGTYYDLSDILVNEGESELVGPDTEFFDSHLMGNLWESLEQYEDQMLIA